MTGRHSEDTEPMADTPQLPEDISALTDDQLRALAEQYQAAGAAVAAQAVGDGDAEATAIAIAAAEGFQAVADELGGREEARREEAERAQRALDILGVSPAADENADPDAPAEGDAPAEQVAASATTTTMATTMATIPPDPAAPAPDPVVPAPTLEATLADTPTLADDSLDLSDVPDPVGALAALTDAAATPRSTVPAQPKRLRVKSRYRDPGNLIQFTDLGMVDQSERDKAMTPRKLAESIAEKYDAVKRFGVSRGGAPIKMASALAQHDVKLGGDPIMNAHLLRQASQDMAAVVASGGNCAIPTNNYDVFNAAEEQSPVEGFLRGMGAERGGMRYLSAPDWVASQAGVAVTTEAQDALGYSNQDPAGPTPPKVCYQAECPAELECLVDAVSACAGFGNLTYRTAPELVEVLLDQLAVAHAQAKEITYLDAIEDGSTLVAPTADTYGAIRSSVLAIDTMVWAYKKRNHIGRNMPIDVLAPDTLIPTFKADAVADFALGLNFMDVDQETLAAQLLESMNINVEFYYDYSTDTGAASAMQEAQAAGHLHNLVNDFRVYAYAPGTWIRLDGGLLNVGLVRDSILNSQNNLQLFSEEWTQACKVGFESMALDLTLCASGIGPLGTETQRTCAS